MQDESLREENAKLKEENKQMLVMIEQLEKKNFDITIEMTATNDALKKRHCQSSTNRFWSGN